MGDNELSLVKFNVVNFYSVLINALPFQPISSKLIKIVESILQAEPEYDKEKGKRLTWLYENTNSKVKVNLPLVELAVFKNLDKGLSKEIDLHDRAFYLAELYHYIDELNGELTKMVVDIAKKYSMDIPFLNTTQDKVSFGK